MSAVIHKGIAFKSGEYTRTIKSTDIHEVEEAIKEIQKILINDTLIPMDSAKTINNNLLKIKEKIR